MAVQNAHVYAQNEGRAYPIDDSASCVSDAGVRVPPDLITDLTIRWPNVLGDYAFIAGLHVTPVLVTLTIQASNSTDTPTEFVPLAVVSIRQPVQVGRMYAITPQAQGVGGWIVFGGGTSSLRYSGRFTGPKQSKLTPRCARPYRPLPVKSLQVQGASTTLDGVVILKASDPLKFTKEQRFIANAFRDCIVVSLVDNNGSDGFPVPAQASNIVGLTQPSVFQQFAGPCAGRPESNTCNCPEPIQFINAVSPDCNGVITLKFDGCTQLASVDGSSVLVTCEMSLANACLPLQIPTSDGLLPFELTPAVIPPVPPVVPPPPVPPTIPLPPPPPITLPFTACIYNETADLTPIQGVWHYSDVGAVTPVCSFSESVSISASSSLREVITRGSLEVASTAYRSIALFDVEDVTTSGRRVTTEAMILAGFAGDKHNAQLIINYRPTDITESTFIYYAAQIDYDTQTFSLVRWNNTVFQVITPATVITPGIQLDTWYRITATVTRVGTTSAETITIRLESVSNPGVIDVTLSAVVYDYQPDTGKFGVGSNRAVARFGYMVIAAYP